jgi:dimethylargininase
MFTKAIVRKPGRSVVTGITTANLGEVDFHLMIRQHEAYVQTLMDCGLNVTILDAAEEFPDSVFMEDVALLTPKVAIITWPGAVSRLGEEQMVKPVLERFYQNVEAIQSPGTIEAGDIMMIGNHFFIGISERTNPEGANQMIKILEKYGHTGSTIHFEDMLHLKTGCSYLEKKNLVVAKAFSELPEFESFNKILVDEDESYAANCIWINDNVLIPSGNPKLISQIQDIGYKVIGLDMSEFRKLDGGLSCLSLRF